MRQVAKRFLAIALAMVLFLVSTGGSNVSAAASPRLSITKKTLTVGEQVTIKLTNNKKTVKWSTSNKNIKIVGKNSKQAKIKAVKKGSSYLQAKVGKKTYKCKITVNQKKASGSGAKVSKGIEYTVSRTEKGVVAIATNTNNYDAKVEVYAEFYKGGELIDSGYDNNYCLGRSATGVFNVTTSCDYDKYKFSVIRVEKSGHKSMSSKCKVSGVNIDPNSNIYTVNAMVKNNSGKEIDRCRVSCVFYDENGNVLGTDYEEVFYISTPGTSESLGFYVFRKDYSKVIPASVKIYVDSAYEW